MPDTLAATKPLRRRRVRSAGNQPEGNEDDDGAERS